MSALRAPAKTVKGQFMRYSKYMSPEIHKKLGKFFRRITDDLIDCAEDLRRSYPQQAAIRRQWKKAYNAVQELRSALDDLCASECPHNDENFYTYYGEPRSRKEETPL